MSHSKKQTRSDWIIRSEMNQEQDVSTEEFPEGAYGAGKRGGSSVHADKSRPDSGKPAN